MHSFTYLLTYLHSWFAAYKTAISPKRLKIERKLLLTGYIKSYTGFWLPPKCMTLNNSWARFKIIDSLNAAKMTKYSLVIIPTLCGVAECIIGLSVRRTYSCARSLTYLLTQLARAYIKPSISSPKRLKIERKLLLTVYIKSFTGFRLPPKYMTLNDLWARFTVTDSLNAAKMTKYSLVMTPTRCRVL